jgi:regulatory protein SWI5
MVSEQRTNTGLNNIPQQVLREAQKQSMARPGPQQQQQQQPYANLASGENYLMSPHGTPQMQGFDGQCFDTLQGPQGMNMSYNMFNEQMIAFKKNPESFSDNMTASQDFELYPSSTMSTPTFVSFNESPSGGPGWISEGETASTRRSSRRISNGIMDRVSKFETMGLEDSQRPSTPPHQNANGTSSPEERDERG